MTSELLPYAKPGHIGGRLMRRLIGFLREQEIALPIASDILIAVSGGPDSIALAHLLVHFGRRIGARNRIHLLHVNHHWRDEDSDQDEAFVQSLGEQWGVPVCVEHLNPPSLDDAQSWEEMARAERKKIFLRESERLGGAYVFTGHHADDLAETVIWRFFTGALDSHGGGIYAHRGIEVRPFLTTRKSEILDYLKEVHQAFQMDSTNESDRFLRAKMRKTLMPEVERLFPKAIEHLVCFALEQQMKQKQIQETGQKSLEIGSQSELGRNFVRIMQESVYKKSGIKLRRNHLNALLEGQDVFLPEGWKLIRTKK